MAKGHRAWALVLIPSLLISIVLWRMPDTAGESPIWTALIWLLLLLAAVIAIVIGRAANMRGRELALIAAWGAASALLLDPVIATTWFIVSVLVGS